MLQLQFRLQSPGRVAGRPVNGQFQHGRPPVIATGGRPAESRCEPASLRWWPCRPQLLQARLSVAHQYPCHPIDEWPTILEFGIRRAGKPFGGTEDLSATTEEHAGLSQEDFRGAYRWGFRARNRTPPSTSRFWRYTTNWLLFSSSANEKASGGRD